MKRIDIETDDGTCPAYVFTPDGSGPWPGVLFFIDGIGMRPAMHELGEKLASAGYYVLQPDLFYRAGAYTAPDPKALFSDPAARGEWFGKAQKAASVDKIMSDTKAFLAHFDVAPQVKKGPVGLTGYCMGGGMSLTAAAIYPDRVAAAAVYHPGGLVTDQPDSPHLLAPKIRARVYIGGAMEDQAFTNEHKQMLDQALTAAGVDHVIETYNARHGWVPSDTPVHDDAATERHWQTLLGLFKRSLA
jgi:carboxymethylenebutenolidase